MMKRKYTASLVSVCTILFKTKKTRYIFLECLDGFYERFRKLSILNYLFSQFSLHDSSQATSVANP